MTTPRAVWPRALAVSLLALGFLGCFATVPTEVPTVRPIKAEDLKTLAGTWEGVYNPPDGRSFPLSLQINANQTYETRADALSSGGAVQVREDKLVLIPRDASGTIVASPSTATLLVFPDGIRVLSGTGAGETGPFSFEVRSPEPKKK